MPGPWPGIRVAVGDSIYARLTDDIVDNFDNVKLRICAQTLLQPLDETMSLIRSACCRLRAGLHPFPISARVASAGAPAELRMYR
jgi:hypothetical protein